MLTPGQSHATGANFGMLCRTLATVTIVSAINCSGANAGETWHACAELAGDLFAQATSGESMEFCSNFREGWIFRLHPASSDKMSMMNGDVSQILSWNYDLADPGKGVELRAFELVPFSGSTPGLYRVLMRNGTEKHSRSGPHEYFLWVRDIRVGGGSNRWKSSVLFRCTTSIGGGCITYYTAATCNGGWFPFPGSWEKRQPVISVRSASPEYSEDLMVNYEMAQEVVDIALDSILKKSCKGG